MFSRQVSEALRVLAAIVRLQKGPEDLPVSVPLLALMVVLSLIPDLVLAAILPQTEATLSPAVPLAVTTVFAVLWYTGMLRLAGKRERAIQTLTAVFGVQFVAGPALVFSAWFFTVYREDADLQVPAAFVGLVVSIWMLVILTRILRSATEWPVFACTLATIASQIFAWQVLQSLIPAAATAPT